jgi:hypothetical protein
MPFNPTHRDRKKQFFFEKKNQKTFINQADQAKRFTA